MLAGLPLPAAAVHAQPADGFGRGLDEVVIQPLRDLNLMPGHIPPRLLAIVRRPYALDGLDTCVAMAWEIVQLDALLPLDVAADDNAGRRSLRDGMIAQGRSMMGGLIPFRGLVREVSGANAADQRLFYAIRTGEARRSFLKGVGQARGCAAPAAGEPAPTLRYEDPDARPAADPRLLPHPRRTPHPRLTYVLAGL